MKMAPVAEVKAKFSAYLEETSRGPVVVTKNGRPAAVLVQMTDPDELERFILAHSPRFTALLDASEERMRRDGGLSGDELLREVARRSKPKRRKTA